MGKTIECCMCNSLQWGSVLSDGEGFSTMSGRRPDCFSLQWGSVLSDGEGRTHRWLLPGLESASMGLRPLRRRRLQKIQTLHLQFSSFNGAPSSQTEKDNSSKISRTFSFLASMGLRSLRRRRVFSMSNNISRISSFNGAPSSQTEKAALRAAGRQRAALASMGLRPLRRRRSAISWRQAVDPLRFNGAPSSQTEKAENGLGPAGIATASLQWGSVLSDGEGRQRAPGRMPGNSGLQWGSVLSDGEGIINVGN